MNEIAESAIDVLQAIAKIGTEEAEKAMLKQEQGECPVLHHFGPGIYIREVHIPAGGIAIGHEHKTEHMNIMLKGKMSLLNDDGTVSVIEAPFMKVTKPGRKVAYIHEDVVWQNIFATDETDIETLENMFLNKSDEFKASEEQRKNIENMQREVDRDDYLKAIEEYGYSHDEAVKITEDHSDMDFRPFNNVMISDSPIQGKGAFITYPIKKGEIIGQARLDGKRTIIGRYANHSMNPTAEMVDLGNNTVNVIALRDLKGCIGGQPGDEITVNYRHVLNLSRSKK